MIRTNVFLPEPLLAKFRKLAKATDTTVAEHIRRAMEAYLRTLKKKS